MKFTIDIETIPCADKTPFMEEAKTNFKAPSGLTKEQAGADLGLTGDKLKYTSKDACIALWEAQMAPLKAESVGEANWRKTALDGAQGRVLSIAYKRLESEAILVIIDPVDEAELLNTFFADIITMLDDRQPFFIGHNITFDLKFLFRRAVILGVRPPFRLPFKGRHDSDYYCTMQGWCGDYQERIKLDDLAIALGFTGKQGFDGSMICDAWLRGELERIAEYNKDDVLLTEKIYRKLNFI